MDLEYFIRTKADIDALVKTGEALKKNIEYSKQYGIEAKAMEAELERVDKALKSEHVGLVAVADGYQKIIAHSKTLGQSTADLEGELSKINASLGKQAKEAQITAQALDSVNPVHAEMARKIQGSSKAQLEAAGTAGAMEGAMTAAGMAAAGYAAVLGVATAALHEYAKAEEAAIDQDAALANQGNLTTSIRNQFRELAEQMEEATNIANDKWGAVITQLSRKRVKPEDMDEAVNGVKLLAGVMGTDIDSAASVFTKAIDGNNRILKRFGIDLSDFHDRGQRLKVLLEELGGANDVLAAKSETVDGSLRGFTNSVSSLLQTLGGWIAKSQILQGVLQFTTRMVNLFTKGIKDDLAPALGEAEVRSDKLVNKFGMLGEKSEESGAEMIDAMTAAGVAIDTASQKVKNMNINLEHQIDALKRIAGLEDAKFGEKLLREMADIDEQEADRKISPAQANIARAGARTRSAFDQEQTRLIYLQQQEAASGAVRSAATKTADDAANALDSAEKTLRSKTIMATGGYDDPKAIDRAYAESTKKIRDLEKPGQRFKLDESGNPILNPLTKEPIMINGSITPTEPSHYDKLMLARYDELGDRTPDAVSANKRRAEDEKTVQENREAHKAAIEEYNTLEAIIKQRAKVKELKEKLANAEEDEKAILTKTEKEGAETRTAIALSKEKLATLQKTGRIDVRKAQIEYNKEEIDRLNLEAGAQQRDMETRLKVAGDNIDPTTKAQLQGRIAQSKLDVLNRKMSDPKLSVTDRLDLESQKGAILGELTAGFTGESKSYFDKTKEGGLRGPAPVDPSKFLGATPSDYVTPPTDATVSGGVILKPKKVGSLDDVINQTIYGYPNGIGPDTRTPYQGKSGIGPDTRPIEEMTAQTVRSMSQSGGNVVQAIIGLGESILKQNSATIKAVEDLRTRIDRVDENVKNQRND